MPDRIIKIEDQNGNFDIVIAEIDGVRIEAKRHGDDVWDVRTMSAPRLPNFTSCKLEKLLRKYDDDQLPCTCKLCVAGLTS